MYSVILSKDKNFLCTLQHSDKQNHFSKSVEVSDSSFPVPPAEAQSQQFLKANSNSFKRYLAYLFLSEIWYSLYAEKHCLFYW